jgi:hypothetical protein
MIENRMRVEREIDRGRIDFSEERGQPAKASQGLPLLDPRQAAETAMETDSDQSQQQQRQRPSRAAAATAGAATPPESAAARRRRQLINRLGLGTGGRPSARRSAGPKLPSMSQILSAGRDGATGHHIDSMDDLSSEDDGARGHLSGYSSSEMDH